MKYTKYFVSPKKKDAQDRTFLEYINSDEYKSDEWKTL